MLPHTLLHLSLLARRIMNGATVPRQRRHFVLFSHTSHRSEGALALEMLLGKQGGVVGLEGGRGLVPRCSRTDRDHPTIAFAVANTPDPAGPGSH